MAITALLLLVLPSAEVACSGDVPRPLERVLKAYALVNNGLRSMRGTGTYEWSSQRAEENEPRQMKARVHVHFDDDKYHLRVHYEKELVRTVYRDRNEQHERVVDQAPYDLHLICDGDVVYSVKFSDRIKPTGCSGNIFSAELIQTAFAEAGLGFTDPARFWNDVLNLHSVVRTLGTDGIKMISLPNGGYRGTYHLKNAPLVRVEFDVESTGMLTRCRVYNPGEQLPAQTSSLHWARKDETSYVEKLTTIQGFRRDFTKSEFVYDTVEVNVDIDPKEFRITGVAVPEGTRFIDRRPGSQHRMLWFDGKELTPTRVRPIAPYSLPGIESDRTTFP